MSADFVFSGDPCPACCRPLRLVGGGQRIERGRSVRVDEYRCEKGHAFHATVERTAGGAAVYRGLRTGSGVEEGARVHFG